MLLLPFIALGVLYSNHHIVGVACEHLDQQGWYGLTLVPIKSGLNSAESTKRNPDAHEVIVLVLVPDRQIEAIIPSGDYLGLARAEDIGLDIVAIERVVSI